MPQKEAAEFGPRNIYHPDNGEMLWNYYLPQFRDDVIDTFSGIKARLNVSRILAGIGGLGTVAAPVIIDSLSAHVEAAPHFQGSTVGGKRFEISSGNNGVMSRWIDGSVETSYNVYVLGQSGVRVLPRGGSLPEISTQYMVPSIDIAPDTAVCFVLVPFGPSGPLGNSDPLCVIRDIALGASADNLFIRLNESNLATFAWIHPAQGGHDGYRLIPFGGVPRLPVDLPATATGYTHDTLGAPTCYTLATMRGGTIIGFTDLLCGLPGYARFPSALATLTPTPPGPVASTRTATATETPTIILPSPTRTPTITPTPDRTPTLTINPRYSQYQSIESLNYTGSILILATSLVNPQTLQIATGIESDMTNRTDLRRKLIDLNYSVAIFGQGESISSLPGFQGQFYIDNPSLPAAIEHNGGRPILAMREDHILQPERYYPGGISILAHETGHIVQGYALPTSEQQTWTTIVRRLAAQPGFPDNWRDILYYPDDPAFPGDELATETEFFAEVSRVWQARLTSQVRSKDQEVYSFMTNVYGPR